MSPEERILEQLKAHVVDHSEEGLRPEDIEVEAGMFDSGYLDSLGMTLFLEFIASEYAVQISDEDLVGRLTSLDDLAKHIAQQQQQQQ